MGVSVSISSFVFSLNSDDGGRVLGGVEKHATDLTPLHFVLDWCFIVCPPLIVLYTVNRYAPLNPLAFLRSVYGFLYVGFDDFGFSG